MVAAALCLLPALAHAQGGSTFADAAFKEGRRLFDAHQYGAACAKFQTSYDMDPQRNTLQALAICREKEEKWASAWDRYLELARQASRAGEEDKARLARDKASDLEKKLLYVVLVMDQPPTGLDITVDGTKLDASLLGTKLPVDPGPHDVVVTAPGKKPWKQRITVGPSPVEQQVKIAKLEDAPASEQNNGGAQYQLPGPMRPAPSFWTTQRTVGAIVAGAGILSLGGGAVFQIVALSESSKGKDAGREADRLGEPSLGGGDSKCVEGGDTSDCPNRVSQKSRKDAAANNQTVAIVLASTGGAMVVTGIVLIATGGHHGTTATWKPKSSSPLLADFSLSPVAAPTSFGLTGTF
ncbi:MAG: hypothetical protein EOP08_09635 [Proteobacteria bacterium]|nr:MAG: hypothetical protein EOP08_09635 [Pseudomonadota bacterium]